MAKRKKSQPPKRITIRNHSFRLSHALIVVVLVAGFGIWRLYSIFASPELPSDAHVVLQLSHSDGSVSAHLGDDGSLIYDQKPFDIRLTDDGTLTCDNGSADTYTQIKLSSTELTSLRQKIDAAGVNQLANQTDLARPAPGQWVSSSDSLLVGVSDQTQKTIETPAGTPKRPQVQQAEKLLKDACKQSGKRIKNSKLSQLRTGPKLLAVDDVTNLVFPKAEAATLTEVRGPYTGVEDIMHYINNTHRTNFQGAGNNDFGTGLPHPVNLPALQESNCLQSTARYWAEKMARTGFRHSPFVDLIHFFCGTGQNTMAENIAWVYLPDASVDEIGKSLATNLLKSTHHHATIDNWRYDDQGRLVRTTYNLVGYGAYRAIYSDGTYRMYVAQEFVDHNGSK